jgi:hypothetical protein
MCGRLWPDSRSNTLVEPATRRGKRVSLFERATPKAKGRQTDVRVLYARLENEVLTAAKSFQRQAIGGSNERSQPFFGCGPDANAFSLIPKEFYLIDEHFCGSESVQPASLSH